MPLAASFSHLRAARAARDPNPNQGCGLQELDVGQLFSSRDLVAADVTLRHLVRVRVRLRLRLKVRVRLKVRARVKIRVRGSGQGKGEGEGGG